MSSQIFYMTIDEMAKALRSKELSALEITEAHLARIDSIDPQVGAFLTICADQAVSNAKKTDERISNGLFNSLTGIPNQIKDNISTKDIKTTCASMMLSDYIPPYNATVTQSLNDEGSILLGKGNMDEFAMGSSTENSAFKLTTNPWNSAFLPGGSSGGPAAAVSACEVVFSLERGSFSEKIKNTDKTFSLVKVVDFVPPKPKPFSLVYSQIERKIIKGKEDSIKVNLLENLKGSFGFSFNYKEL